MFACGISPSFISRNSEYVLYHKYIQPTKSARQSPHICRSRKLRVARQLNTLQFAGTTHTQRLLVATSTACLPNTLANFKNVTLVQTYLRMVFRTQIALSGLNCIDTMRSYSNTYGKLLNTKFATSGFLNWCFFFNAPWLLMCSFAMPKINFYTTEHRYTNMAPLSSVCVQRSFTAFLRKRSPRYFLREDVVISDVLVRFIERLAGARVSFTLNRSPELDFGSLELAYLALLNTRMWSLFRTPQAFKYWEYFGICVFLMFLSKDPQYLTTWLHNQFSKMSAFSHRRFLSFLTYLLRTIYVEMRDYIGSVGCRIDVVGKISVSGNARSRSVIFKHGRTSFSDMGIKTASSFYLVRTHTGCLGLTVWLFYV